MIKELKQLFNRKTKTHKVNVEGYGEVKLNDFGLYCINLKFHIGAYPLTTVRDLEGNEGTIVGSVKLDTGYVVKVYFKNGDIRMIHPLNLKYICTPDISYSYKMM